MLLQIYFKTERSGNLKIDAASASEVISDQSDWQAGDYSNSLDLTTLPGSMQILTSSSVLDLSGLIVTSDIYQDDRYNVVDGNTGTEWGFPETEGDGHWWKIDLEEPMLISQMRGYFGGDFPPPHTHHDVAYGILGSLDDVTYSQIGNGSGETEEMWHDFSVSGEIARYIKITVYFPVPEEPDDYSNLSEIEITARPFSATHTTGATQIDGQEGSADKDLIEWTSFDPTQEALPGTTIEYAFRTSSDGSNWTAWSVDQEYLGAPLDLTGLTANRYLQVKATLTTTDAGTTPQIDDYTINFHNNQAPNKPTARTVTIE